jgi:hypothetical protein
MPAKNDDKTTMKDVVLTRACVVDKKTVNAGTKLSLPTHDANYLLASKKAALPENYVAPKRKAPAAAPDKK